jgi:hypothetical protein
MSNPALGSAAPPSQTVTIALFGSFNPMIFQPAWLTRQGVMEPELAARTEIVEDDSQLFAFATEKFVLEVSPQRFVVGTHDIELFGELLELVVRIFGTLSHTPVWGAGISHEAFFQLPDQAAVVAALQRFASTSSEWARLLGTPITPSFAVASPRRDGVAGKVRVEVEASEEVPDAVYVGSSDEIEVPEAEEGSLGCLAVIQAVQRAWTPSLDRAMKVFDFVRGELLRD